MRKKLVILLTFLVATLISLSMTNLAHAQYATAINWEPPYKENGYDSLFYNTWVVGYENGTTVNLQVSYYYPYYEYYDNINVTAVRLIFDNGYNVNASIPSPIRINYGYTHTFKISFIANTTNLSNAVAHTYSLIVTYNYTKSASYTDSYPYYDFSPGYEFVVLSANQVDIMTLNTEYQAIYTPWDYFTSSAAQWDAVQAEMQYYLAITYAAEFYYVNATTHLQNATSLMNQAYTAEESYVTTEQQLMVNSTKISNDAAMITANAATTTANAAVTSANAAKTSANGTMNESYGYVLFGVGFILIGIGAIVYGLRKPKSA
jgi:hypothetical protein